jgi:hypothetical protein
MTSMLLLLLLDILRTISQGNMLRMAAVAEVRRRKDPNVTAAFP